MEQLERPPARLNVVLARGAPVGIIFRRGPSRRVQVIKWYTDTDRFEPGQWFKGRIYDYRADLSPDGKYMFYFAAKHKPPLYSWTAISRPPFLTALALWPKGDCWDGGGLFEDRKRLWLNHAPEEAQLADGMSLPKRFQIKAEAGGGEDGPIWYRRLELSGWEELDEGKIRLGDIMTGYKTVTPNVWRRRRPSTCAGDAVHTRLHDAYVQMAISLEGFDRRLQFEVLTADDKRLPFEADWADWDHRGRLVLARRGTIGVLEIEDDGTLIEHELADLNANVYEEIPSPEWARRW